MKLPPPGHLAAMAVVVLAVATFALPRPQRNKQKHQEHTSKGRDRHDSIVLHSRHRDIVPGVLGLIGVLRCALFS